MLTWRMSRQSELAGGWDEVDCHKRPLAGGSKRQYPTHHTATQEIRCPNNAKKASMEFSMPVPCETTHRSRKNHLNHRVEPACVAEVLQAHGPCVLAPALVRVEHILKPNLATLSLCANLRLGQAHLQHPATGSIHHPQYCHRWPQTGSSGIRLWTTTGRLLPPVCVR